MAIAEVLLTIPLPGSLAVTQVSILLIIRGKALVIPGPVAQVSILLIIRGKALVIPGPVAQVSILLIIRSKALVASVLPLPLHLNIIPPVPMVTKYLPFLGLQQEHSHTTLGVGIIRITPDSTSTSSQLN
jgi:hypothetical protein